MAEDFEYSPFDAPVKDPHKIKSETSGGVKMEEISDFELDGKKIDVPGDAPTFEIPKFDEIPNANLGGGGDPFAPGSGNSGGGKSPGSGNSGGDGTKVENGFAKEFSEYTAKWLVDIFFRLLIAGLCQYAKIDKAEVQKAVTDGFIDGKFLKFVDTANDNVDKSINVTDDEKKFVIEPLKYFLEVKKVQLKPEWMFITGILMVGGGLAIKAFDIKKQNKAMLDQMIKESAKDREEARANAERYGTGKKGQETQFNENVANFNQPNAGGNEGPLNFTQPLRKEGGVEIVDVEEIDNDDNAG